MLDKLRERLGKVLKTLKGSGVIKEGHVEETFREIRKVLLEADVHFQVTKVFLQRVKAKALGQKVFESLTPDQHLVKIVHEELCMLLGGQAEELNLKGAPPYVIMMVGIQGAGKTTTVAKLALFLRRKRLHPLLATTDIKRPAALEQLVALGKQAQIHVYPWEKRPKSSISVAENACKFVKNSNYDVLILDTQGRMHANEELMEELAKMKEKVSPREIILVADAMTGQDAVNLAKSFHQCVSLTGIVLSKMDGDARGGCALSMREVAGVPIKFVGTGERLDHLEQFYPGRMASRILGMGDVLSLIDRAKGAFDEKKATELEKKLQKNVFTLEDFKDQLKQIKRLGSFDSVLGMIPGVSRISANIDTDKVEVKIRRMEAILNSMTILERRKPEIINGSRKKRIANGSGTKVQEINQLLKQFSEMRKVMASMTSNKKGMHRLFSSLSSGFPY